jgi:hypothetical protein
VRCSPGSVAVFTQDYIWTWCTRNEKSQVLVAAVIEGPWANAGTRVCLASSSLFRHSYNIIMIFFVFTYNIRLCAVAGCPGNHEIFLFAPASTRLGSAPMINSRESKKIRSHHGAGAASWSCNCELACVVKLESLLSI